MHKDRYTNYAELARHQRNGVDYRITVNRRPSTIAVIAPHAGRIERTGAIARTIAGNDFNLYLFEGTRRSGSYTVLHLTSHRFDEPSCVSLIRGCSTVLTIHGYEGQDECVLVGGLDLELKRRLAEALRHNGIRAGTDGHRFQGSDRHNICNRGQSGRGVQLEISSALRGAARESRLVSATRTVLLSIERTA